MAVPVRTVVSGTFKEFIDRWITPRVLFTQSGTLASLSFSPINSALSTPVFPVNSAFYIKSAVASTSHPMRLQISAGANTSSADAILSSTNPVFFQFNCMPSMNSAVIELDWMLTEAHCPGGQFIGGAIRQLLNADGTAATVNATNAFANIGFIGGTIYNDFNIAARTKIFAVGDSILNATGRTKQSNCWEWKIRQYYASKGINVQLLSRAVSGSTTVAHELHRQSGAWDQDTPPSLFIYQPMANDAAQAISLSTTMSNIQAAILHKQTNWPSAKMLILGCYPAENTTTETNLNNIRSSVGTLVAGLNDPNVLFCNLGTLGTGFSSVTANYAASDVAGSRIHVSDIGDGIIYNSIIQPWLNANIPTI